MRCARRQRPEAVQPLLCCLTTYLLICVVALCLCASASPLISNNELELLRTLATEDNTITDGLPFPFPASHSVSSEASLLSLAEEVQELSSKRSSELPGEVCLLLHGTGSHGPLPGTQADFWVRDADFWVRDAPDSFHKSDLKQAQKLRAYWGELPVFLQHFKACREVVVRSIESIMRTWDNDTLIADYCSALNLEPKPTVVFTHSLANVVIGAGIGWQYPGCNRFVKRDDLAGLRAGGAVWFGVQGPLKGTAASNMCLGVCKGRYDNITHLIEKFKINLARKNCGCGRDPLFPKKPFPATRSCAPLYKSPVVKNGLMIQLRKTRNDGTELHKVPDGVKLKLQSEIAHEFMWGNLCGVTGSSIVWRPFHLHSYLDILSSFVQKFEGSKKGWGVDAKTVIDTKKNRFHGNDGFISFRSCSSLDRKLFRADSSSPFYVLNGNHADGTGRIIDNYEYKDRQPRVWYLLRVRSIKNLRAYGSLDAPNSKKHEKAHVDVVIADPKKAKRAPPPTPAPPPPHPPAPITPPARGRRTSREKPDAVLKSNAKDKQPAVQRGKSTKPTKKPAVKTPPVRSSSLPTTGSARLAAKRRSKLQAKRRKASRRRRHRGRRSKRSKRSRRSKRSKRSRRTRFPHRTLQSSLSSMSREARASLRREVQREQLEDLLSFDDEDDE